MNFKKYIVLLFLVFSFLNAQEKGEVLLTIDGTPVMASEFLRIYKKNLNLVETNNQKSINYYLQLFIDYQLKLKEAHRLNLHKDKSYLNEFSKYKIELTKKYLTENEVTPALLKEAYERSKYEINASHVLVRLDETSDTLKAYNTALKLRERFIKDGFKTLKEEVHDGKTILAEDLGYFSALQMVYDFENVAYDTPVNEVSMPFKTRFGYHILKVNNKRNTKGTLTAAHIMLRLNQEDSLINPEKRIHEIYKKLKQGEKFEALAKQFSDDKNTSQIGGKIRPFKNGQLRAPKFENEAFALEKNGDYSQPFKTRAGWHIVKRLNLEPLESFENLKPKLEERLQRDSRSRLISASVINKLKQQYQINHNPNAKKDFVAVLTPEYYESTWALPAHFKTDKILFSINRQEYTYKSFGDFILTNQRRFKNSPLTYHQIIDRLFKAFFEQTLLKYREENLENDNKEYANILKEYKDGLLIFALLEKELWNKASKDTIGQKNYYDAHKSIYKWKDRVEILMASSAKESDAQLIQKLIKKGKSEDFIDKKINTKNQQNVIFTKGIYETTSPILPENFNSTLGVSNIYKYNEAFHVIDVKDLLPEQLKTFDEAKGAIINDYQKALEHKWIQALRNRYNVKVDESVFNKLKTKLNSN